MFELGSQKIKSYQLFLIFSTVLVEGFLVYFFIIDISIELAVIIGLSLTLFLFLSIIYSKVYCIIFDKEYFYVSNLFFSRKEDFRNFKRIEKTLVFPFLYKICFINKKYYFMVDTTKAYFEKYTGKNNTVEELTLKIINSINTSN
jgi:hypothetical protein